MNIVIDADLFSSIVNIYSSNHDEFKPLLEYVTYGPGKITYGGTKYQIEINRHKTFKSFLVELDRAKKTTIVDKDDVDSVETQLESQFNGSNLNDHHIVAIVIIKGCEIVCSLDRGLHLLINLCYCNTGRQFISGNCKNPGYLRKPKIYQNSKHAVFLRS